MKDIDIMPIEKIIHLPFFYSLEKDGPNPATRMWRITFHCNKPLPDSRWQLLDEISDNVYIVRYKLVDFNH